jgi:hypothetical protein
MGVWGSEDNEHVTMVLALERHRIISKPMKIYFKRRSFIQTEIDITKYLKLISDKRYSVLISAMDEVVY